MRARYRDPTSYVAIKYTRNAQARIDDDTRTRETAYLAD